MPIDYLSGLTKDEAENYIKHLPNLSPEEVSDLQSLAQHKPVTRQGSALESRETTNLRIRYLVDYIKQHPKGATRHEIDEALKYNGANMRRTINEAIRRGLIRMIRNGHQANLYMVTAKGARNWKAPRI